MQNQTVLILKTNNNMENSGYKKFLDLQQKDRNIGGYISVDSVPFSHYHKIGVSNEGYPIFFVKCDNSSPSVDINLELISVLFSQKCSIRESDKGSSDTFTIVLLKTLNRDLQQYFTDVFSIILQQLVSIPTEKALYKEIRKVIDLFSSIHKPAIKSVQGLWTELLVIDSSMNPEYLISSWHINPADKYDFNDGKDKLEVKSTSKQQRVHRFSLEQLQSNVGSKLLIASTIAIETGVGKSILNLRDQIFSKVEHIEIQMRLNEIIYKTIGSDYERLGDVFFDYQLAKDSLLFYNASSLPSIPKSAVPIEITNISFDFDLTNSSPISSDDNLLLESPLFQNLVI